MRHSDENVVEAYTELFEGLSFTDKLNLIESLSKSIRAESSNKEEDFYKSFGAFSSEKSAEEIINEIKT